MFASFKSVFGSETAESGTSMGVAAAAVAAVPTQGAGTPDNDKKPQEAVQKKSSLFNSIFKKEPEEPTSQPQAPIESGLLQITIHFGKNFRKSDIFGSGDPYVIVLINGEQVYKTEVRNGTNEPIWEASLSPLLLSHVSMSEVKFEVWDADVIGKDEVVGDATLRLGRDINLVISPVQLSTSDVDDCGNLYASVKFSPVKMIGPRGDLQ